jgi:hypothetical protein
MASVSRQRCSPFHNALEVWRNIFGHGLRDPKVSTLLQITEQRQFSINTCDGVEHMYLCRPSQRVTNWTFEMQVWQRQRQRQRQRQGSFKSGSEAHPSSYVVHIVTVKFEIDLGSGLRWGEPTVHCL